MALVERLCQVEEDYDRNIALNPFVEAQYSVLKGDHTIAQVKGFYNMTPEDEAEYDTLIARVTAYTTLPERMLACHRIRSILTFWEQGDVPGYQSVADIRDKLEAI